MRYLGLDLGTTSLGVAISDKTNTLVSPLTLIKFKKEDYNDALNKLMEIIKDKNILLEVDGGINDKTINLVNTADIAVVGSYITTSDNMIEKVKTLV